MDQKLNLKVDSGDEGKRKPHIAVKVNVNKDDSNVQGVTVNPNLEV